MCNEKLKFGNLWGKAEALGCDFIANGPLRHYRSITAIARFLRKGIDPRKDQSYFLFQPAPAAAPPRADAAWNNAKPEIRKIARSLGLKVAGQDRQSGDLFRPGK